MTGTQGSDVSGGEPGGASGRKLAPIPAFEFLTNAEAEVFDPHLVEVHHAKGDALAVDDALIIVRGGSLEFLIGADDHSRVVATVEAGGVAGEIALFDPEPIATRARAGEECDCLTINRRALKHCFRYSRTAAVKWMIVFAKSLSAKLRAVNQQVQGGDGEALSTDLRPARLSVVDLAHLGPYTVDRTFEAGEAIFREGEASEELYVIDEGAVEISRAADDDRKVVLASLSRGDFFGEMSYIDQRPRSAAAHALTPVKVEVVPAFTLDEVLEQAVGVGLYLTNVLCKIMARRLNVSLKRIS